ncbi:hypothetical protein Bca101_087359 [Brassica carinata]
MFPSLALATAPMPLTIISATRRSQVTQLNAKKTKPEKKRATTTTSTSGFSGGTAKELTWQCIEGCGACCKLAKDFAFATPDDDPDDVELYRSMIGDDGWCINYDKATCKCSIYAGSFFSKSFVFFSLIWRVKQCSIFVTLPVYKSAIFLPG